MVQETNVKNQMVRIEMNELLPGSFEVRERLGKPFGHIIGKSFLFSNQL